MKILKTARNYFCYCGIEKDEYKALKKDAYVSNFNVWRILLCLMTATFAFLFVCSLFIPFMAINRTFYLIAFLFSAVAAGLFLFVLKRESFFAQLLIYLSISLLFVLGALITQNKPENPATTFIVLLLISPMFMIDKPYFMSIELVAASVVYLVWMHEVKPFDVWKVDLVNVVCFAVIGIFIHVIANSIRIKEFVLARKIAIQKDADDLTGLYNKGAVTREIDAYLADESESKGIMLLLDINHFKSVNDTFGHDVGDDVIRQLGVFLAEAFTDKEIVGRFGGDEFIVFIRKTDDIAVAEQAAKRIIDGAAEHIVLPNGERTVSVSIGAALYRGKEKNYSEIFKKADIALYRTKADRTLHLAFYTEPTENG